MFKTPSACIEADQDAVAKVVLMPGDPLRAKYIAETYLENPVLFNTVRNMLGYTGTYKGKRISVMGSGMGIPSAVATLLFDLDYVVLDKLMVSYHDLALAAIGIVLKVERFPLNVGIGICQGMLPLVAYNYSAGNKKRMEDAIRLSRTLGLVIAGISILLYELFAPQLANLFISDSQTVALATQFLRIRVLATPLMFLSFFTVYLFQSFGKGRISLFLGVTRWLGFNIPMLFLLNALVGMYGLVWSQVTADTLTVILSFWVYFRFRPRLKED